MFRHNWNGANRHRHQRYNHQWSLFAKHLALSLKLMRLLTPP
jgi:hypothetical protein